MGTTKYGIFGDFNASNEDFILPKCIAVVDVIQTRTTGAIGGTCPTYIYCAPHLHSPAPEARLRRNLLFEYISEYPGDLDGDNPVKKIPFAFPFSYRRPHRRILDETEVQRYEIEFNAFYMGVMIATGYIPRSKEQKMVSEPNKLPSIGQMIEAYTNPKDCTHIGISYRNMSNPDTFVGVEYRGGGRQSNTGDLSISVINMTRSNTVIPFKVRLYIYDLSGLGTKSFMFNLFQQRDEYSDNFNAYGMEVYKYELSNKDAGIYRDINQNDLDSRRVLAFESAAHYMKIAGSLDLREDISHYKGANNIHIAGQSRGIELQLKDKNGKNNGLARRVEQIPFNLNESALFVYNYTAPFTELNDYHLYDEALPAYAYKVGRDNAFDFTSLKILRGVYGPIITQLPKLISFANVKSIDDFIA